MHLVKKSPARNEGRTVVAYTKRYDQLTRSMTAYRKSMNFEGRKLATLIIKRKLGG